MGDRTRDTDQDEHATPEATGSVNGEEHASVLETALETDGGSGGGDGESGGAEGSDGTDEDEPETDGGVRAYTVRLELVDEPGELLRTLEPIATRGANLLSIHHERGNITPRGHIPVEVDIECPPDRFEGIVDALREAGVNVIQAGADRYGEEVNVILVGHLVETDLSDTLSAIQTSAHTSVVDLSLAAPEGMDAVSSARVRLAVNTGRAEDALTAVREIADEKGLCVVEPLPGGDT